MGLAVACNGAAPRPDMDTTVGMTADGTSTTPSTSTSTEPTAGSEDGGPDLGSLDLPPPGGAGCEAIDFLFVIDNSESMATHQQRLGEQFPSFITAMFDALPEGISVHVGLTTTDFDEGCEAPESTMNCQSTATVDEVESHYQRPDDGSDGGNGTQGRLFSYSNTTFFEINADDDPTPLSDWFSEAAVAAGEDGCSFEMPVAAAGFAAHSANDDTNAGFIRDSGALLVVFFLTDEPDKSPESRTIYEQMLLDAKTECGGAQCIFVGGLIPACTLDVNQKLWQFMSSLQDEPHWADIETTTDYADVFGDALAAAIAEACANIPEG